ncbi:hypothetical protein [uncultured Prevotella sp.]|uniref:hypothetical protein n=1 Tax=uncultured Prevotella sp. TaxID=159272 RepID=UPI0027E2BE1B|nr:hypothetical protein [uncultured Prevotella sp.]
MANKDIHNLIERYFDATLSIKEEALLKQLLAETQEDTEDIREAKATMGLFATKRKISNKVLADKTPKKKWNKLKYAAAIVFGVLLDLFLDIDDSSKKI